MSTPNIDVASPLGKAMAQTLRMSTEQLDAVDGKKNGIFEIYRIKSVFEKQNPEIEALRKRIVYPNSRLTGICENTFFIDNGDGKVGEGDLFLHADGYYEEKSRNGSLTYAFRFAPLFAPRSVQSKSGSPARESAALTPEADRIAKAVEGLKGKRWDDPKVKAVFKDVCGK